MVTPEKVIVWRTARDCAVAEWHRHVQPPATYLDSGFFTTPRRWPAMIRRMWSVTRFWTVAEDAVRKEMERELR